jgi:hypothetical protein
VEWEQDPDNFSAYRHVISLSYTQRIELSPAVSGILEVNTPNAKLLRDYLRLTDAILAPKPAEIAIES